MTVQSISIFSGWHGCKKNTNSKKDCFRIVFRSWLCVDRLVLLVFAVLCLRHEVNASQGTCTGGGATTWMRVVSLQCSMHYDDVEREGLDVVWSCSLMWAGIGTKGAGWCGLCVGAGVYFRFNLKGKYQGCTLATIGWRRVPFSFVDNLQEFSAIEFA